MKNNQSVASRPQVPESGTTQFPLEVYQQARLELTEIQKGHIILTKKMRALGDYYLFIEESDIALWQEFIGDALAHLSLMTESLLRMECDIQ